MHKSWLMAKQAIEAALFTVGIVILFGSTNIASLQYHVYPPYGLVTEAFIPLRSVPLICWDFHLSQKHISRCGSEERVLQK